MAANGVWHMAYGVRRRRRVARIHVAGAPNLDEFLDGPIPIRWNVLCSLSYHTGPLSYLEGGR